MYVPLCLWPKTHVGVSRYSVLCLLPVVLLLSYIFRAAIFQIQYLLPACCKMFLFVINLLYMSEEGIKSLKRLCLHQQNVNTSGLSACHILIGERRRLVDVVRVIPDSSSIFIFSTHRL